MRSVRLRSIWSRGVRSGVVMFLSAFVFVTSAAAQNATSGINGRVTDSTSGALPGVTVSITSPALQVPSMTTTTEADGTYRFIQLPAGTYEVKYELQGFKPTVRQGVVLAVGFIATLNPALEIGGVEETITVSGASPVVDTTNNTVTSRLSVTQLLAIPSARRPNDVALMTPGMMSSTVPIVTAVGLSGQANTVTSGGLANFRLVFDGVEGTGPGRNGDMGNVEEVDVTQSGGTADIAQAGIYMNVIAKSGGNQFHGRYAAVSTGKALQGSNIDANLNRQGITTAVQSTSYFTDLTGDLGGRVVRDKLWFYGSLRDRRSKVGVLGVVNGPHRPNPNDPYLPTAWNDVFNVKLSYQMTHKYQVTGFVNQEYYQDNGANLTRFVPEESSRTLRHNPVAWNGNFKGTFTNRLLLTALVGRDYAYPKYYAQRGTANLPSTLDLATQQVTGRAYPLDKRVLNSWQQRTDLTYLPSGSLLGIGGNHELRVGMRTISGYTDTNHFDDPAGNYILVFNTIGGVPHTPTQLKAYNAPIIPHSPARFFSAWVTDRVTVGRLTMNLGFRYDRFHAWVPPQTKAAPADPDFAKVFPALNIPRIEVGTFNLPAPRAGFAYNLTKDAKTVLKGTYGWFNDTMTQQYAADYNPNVDNIVTYSWHDLNLDGLYQPGEVNLALNGPDFLSISGATANILNPNLKWQHVHELTGSIERELAAGMGLRFLYTYRRYADEQSWSNVKRPYSAFNIPITVTDPGPTGKGTTGPQLTLWTYPASYAGAAFVGNEKINVPGGNDDHFQTLELTLTKRLSHNWDATVSGSATKYHQWLRTNPTAIPGFQTNDVSAAVPQSPNDLLFPLNTTTEWSGRATVSYIMPLDIRVASLLFFENGVYGQRTFAFPGIPQQGVVTLRLEPWGAEKGPVRKVVNLRLSKLFKFSQNRTIEAYMDAINLINSNAAWGVTYQSGPTFGYATSIFPARLFQFGGAFEF